MYILFTGGCGLLKIGEFFSTSFCRRDTEHFFFIVVKIARITRSFTLRDERRLHLRITQKQVKLKSVNNQHKAVAHKQQLILVEIP
jgi:hypothetical protein